MVLQSPFFEIAQYVLAILRSILATGRRYEHWSYSVQRSTHNIYVSSTRLCHHAWYCLLCPKPLDCPYLPTMSALDYGGWSTENLGDTTDARQMLSYYLFIYLQIYWNLSLWWKFVQARRGMQLRWCSWLKQMQLLKKSSGSWYSDSWFLHSILELAEL